MERGLDRKAIAHGLRLALAALLAFTIAAFFHVENASWAAMPVFVVAQPTRGLLIERAVLRLLGTIVGAGAGLLFLQLPVGPIGTLALLGVWVVLNGGLSPLLRGGRGYGALLAGITAAIVVLPSILEPDHPLDLAMARIQCTLIGVVCVTLVTGLFTPSGPGDTQAVPAARRSRAATAVFAGGATFAAGSAGYLSGWPMAELAALGICIFAMVLGSLPDPRSAVPVMMHGLMAGLAGALVYRWGVQPQVAGLPSLVLSIAPFILVGSLAQASRAFGGPALNANMCFLLASHAGLPATADLAPVLNEAAALVLANALVGASVMVLPVEPVRADDAKERADPR